MEKKNLSFWFVCFFSLGMLLTSLSLLLIAIITGNDPENRLSSHIITVLLNALVIFLILRQKSSNHFLLTYASIYIFFAVFLGASLNFYNLFENINFDKIVHVFFGYSASLVGLIILNKLNHYENSKMLFILIFIFSFSMMTAAVWEIFEFSSDQIFNTVTQGKPYYAYDGRKIVDVGETMYDIISNLTGTVIFLIQLSIFKNKAITSYMIASTLK